MSYLFGWRLTCGEGSMRKLVCRLMVADPWLGDVGSRKSASDTKPASSRYCLQFLNLLAVKYFSRAFGRRPSGNIGVLEACCRLQRWITPCSSCPHLLLIEQGRLARRRVPNRARGCTIRTIRALSDEWQCVYITLLSVAQKGLSTAQGWCQA